MVHFDELFNLLMDEILEEEVRYLNGLEREYEKVETGGKKENGNTKLVELVRTLDELCDR